MLRRLGSSLRAWRQHGISRASYFYRSQECVIVGSGLAGPPADDRVGDIVFRLATPADLDNLDELERYGRGSRQRVFVERDHDWLFVACHGDRIVATARYGRVVRDDVISRVFQLGPGQVWAPDAFCLPEYRNKGISRMLALFANRILASLGYTDVASSVLVTNIASLRMTLHKNQPLYYVSYVRILSWERLRASKQIPQHFWDRLR
jgi:GNAT superfamily N-acetyltransferase